jgi:hypothetical protein
LCSEKAVCIKCSDKAELDGSSTCHCVTGAYKDINVTCKDCHYSCSTCENGENCTECKDIRVRPIAQGYCFCPEGYGENEAKDCIVCNEGCISCVLKAEWCLSCKDNRVLLGCSCPSGTSLKFNNIKVILLMIWNIVGNVRLTVQLVKITIKTVQNALVDD